MKLWTIPLFCLMLAPLAQAEEALTAQSYLQNFSQETELDRSADAYQLCEEAFAAWPGAEYAAKIHQLGQAWKQNAEAAYYVLRTCNTIWISRYLDTIAFAKTKNAMQGIQAANNLAALDLIDASKYFAEQIQGYSDLGLRANQNIPPSPYELITDLASGKAQLDLAVTNEKRKAITNLAVAGANVTWFGNSLRNVGTTVAESGLSRTVRQALVISAFIYGLGEMINEAQWKIREHELWSHEYDVIEKVLHPANTLELNVSLNEFFSSSERLGYFYNYNLYLADSNANAEPPALNERCYADQKAFFGPEKKPQHDLAKAFLRGKICGDAVTVWIGAALFLQQRYPDNRHAQILYERLIERAKRGFIAYEQTKAYEESQPKCFPFFENPLYKECIDPKTGKRTIVGGAA